MIPFCNRIKSLKYAVTYKNGSTDTISKVSTTAEGSRCLGNGCFVAGTLVRALIYGTR